MSYVHAPVAQLDRVSDSDSEGRWFESSRAYHERNLFCLPRQERFFSYAHTALGSRNGCRGRFLCSVEKFGALRYNQFDQLEFVGERLWLLKQSVCY